MSRKGSEGVVAFWTMAREWLHAYLPKVRRASSKTVEAYRIALEALVAFICAHDGIGRSRVGFDEIDRPHVKAWAEWMGGEAGYSPKTVNLRLTALRSFMRYCSAEDASLTAIACQVEAVRGPRVPKRPVDYMGRDETAAVLAAFTGRTAKERRNRMMLVLLYETGARVSELVDAETSDLSLGEPARIVLTGKGSKSRVVPIGDRCAAHLRVYLEEFHPMFGRGESAPLFYSMRDGRPHPLSVDTVTAVLKRAGDIARSSCPTVPERLHCHLIRKTRAMDLYQSGIPLPIIMRLLGHESMSTTSTFYAFATADMMEKAVRNAMPEELSNAKWPSRERIEALYSLR